MVYRRIRMFFGHWFTTIGRKSAISDSSLALECTPWLLPREQYGLVTGSYSTELARADEVSNEKARVHHAARRRGCGGMLTHPRCCAAERLTESQGARASGNRAITCLARSRR